MSDNSFKGKIRRRQKDTGESYMRARRQVDNRSAGGEPAAIPETADATRMLSLLGLGKAEATDIAALWAARALPVGTNEPVNLASLLKVPIGLGANGAPVWLDLKDEADGGAGPHLTQVGTTGSGRTVVLRAMLVGLCAQHSPELLQMVLVDAKGGAFEGFAEYPHTAAILGPDDCCDALRNLLDARSRALHAAGADGHLGRYRELRATTAGADLPALPDVIVVIDERRVLEHAVAGFSSVLSQLMRQGRSLGIHVIAGSEGDAQEQSEVARHVNCRVALRTRTAEDAQQLMGNADAHKLPRGAGLYSPEWGVEPVRFRGFSISPDLIADLGSRFRAACAAA